MSTPFSAGFAPFVSGTELSHILSGTGGVDFDHLFTSTAGTTDNFTGTVDDDKFVIQLADGDTASGGAGYDAVFAESDSSGDPLVLDPSTEAGVLTGPNEGSIIGNSLDNLLVGN